MEIRRLWLIDYRNYVSTEVSLAPEGLTVLTGGNGQGKTNLLEAIAYTATMRSFRGVPTEALVRQGCTRAVVRADVARAGREVLIEAELVLNGRDRAQVNRQVLRRARDLIGVFQVSVFSPDDLSLVKGGPAERRRYLDETLVSLHPSVEQLRSDVEHVLRQRNTLLKQAGGRATSSVVATLDVWDAQLARLGTSLAAQRESLVQRLGPLVVGAYGGLAGGGTTAEWPTRPILTYRYSWEGLLGDALASKRGEDLRRGVTTVGPQRDELEMSLAGSGGALSTRTHASQGEQRSLALALRLAAHHLVIEETGETPVLLLDDVFSELDESRAVALLGLLPPGQSVLATAGPLPPGASPACQLGVQAGSIRPSS